MICYKLVSGNNKARPISPQDGDTEKVVDIPRKNRINIIANASNFDNEKGKFKNLNTTDRSNITETPHGDSSSVI